MGHKTVTKILRNKYGIKGYIQITNIMIQSTYNKGGCSSEKKNN